MQLPDSPVETAARPRFETALLATARQVRRIYGLWLGTLDLTLADGLLLAYVEANGPTMQSKLAEVLGLGRPATGDVVDSLVKQGLVVREPAPADRRVWLVAVTDEGRVQASRVAELDAHLARLLRDGLSRSQRAQLGELLSVLQENSARILAEWPQGRAL